MGRAAVRQATAAALTTAGIPYVGAVYPARPTILQEEDYVQTLNGQAISASKNGSACVVVVNLTEDQRQLQAFTGFAGVNDTNIHQVCLEMFFACTAGTAVLAQQDYDTVVDALFVAIRNNPTLSAPAAIWAAGVYEGGVKHAQEEPYTPDTGLTVLINGTVRFAAYEWVAGSGV